MAYTPRGMFDPLQVYANRDYSCHRLDSRVFSILNALPLEASTVHLSCSGCLDAISQIPGGSMRGPKAGPIQTYISREDLDTTPQQRRDRDAWCSKLIDEILAEIAKEDAA